MRSIRRELTTRLLGGALVMLLLAGVFLSMNLHSRIVLEFDRSLEAKARTLATLAVREGRGLEVDFAGEYMPEFEREHDAEYFQFWLQDGSLIERSDSLGEQDLPFSPSRVDTPFFRNTRLPDGRRGRLVQISFPPREIDEDKVGLGEDDDSDDDEDFRIPEALDAGSLYVTLAAARSREDLNSLLMSLYLTLGITAGLLLLGIALLVHHSLRAGLKPIDTLNAQVKAIGSRALDRRLDLTSPPAELLAVLDAINGLLDRLESAFLRERRFSTDAAHELRTPIAELRAACKVGAKWPDEPEAVHQFFHDIRSVAAQMDRVVTDLLTLARCDDRTEAVKTENVSVAPMVWACWGRVSDLAKSNNLGMDDRIDPNVTVRTDRAKLEMIIQNLVDNAAFYSVGDSDVVFFSVVINGRLALVVENPPCDLHPADLEHVFKRFWRKDSTRIGNQHSGLGLSLVASLTDLLGIGVHAELAPSSVFQVSFFPFPTFVDPRIPTRLNAVPYTVRIRFLDRFRT